MKRCSICQTLKDESLFPRRSDDRGDGLLAHCLDCQSEKNRLHYEANKEKIRTRNAERQRLIRAGNYIPDSTSHSRKRHEKPIPPPAKVAFNPLILRVDDSELAFLHQIATQRGADAGDKVQITIKINEFLRELLHAGMIAHERKKET